MIVSRPVLFAAMAGFWAGPALAQSASTPVAQDPAPQTLPQVNVAPSRTPGAGAGSAGSLPAGNPGDPQKVSSGLLECRGEFATGMGFGSSRKVRCEFRSTAGRNHYYVGTMERVGLDFGVSDQGSMLWGVVATAPTLQPGALAGTYVGFTSGFAVGPGFSANVLASQDASRQITLQPVSISSDSGLSISIAGVTLILEPSTAVEAGDPPPAPNR